MCFFVSTKINYFQIVFNVLAIQTPYVYYQTIAELLKNSYDIKNYGFGALIRILVGPPGNPDFLSVKSGIDLAFEQILLRKHSKRADDALMDLNILKNLLKLVR